MSDLQDKALELLERFETLAVEFTPKVIDAAVDVTMVNGMQQLLTSVILLIVSVLSYKCCKFNYTKFDTCDIDSGGALAYSVVCIVCCAICIILPIIAVPLLFDVWNWVALFNPELALARQIMGM